MRKMVICGQKRLLLWQAGIIVCPIIITTVIIITITYTVLCSCLSHDAAAQMWLMARIIPLIIGDLVPEGDPYWENYLTMMRITDLLFASKLHEDGVGYLAHTPHPSTHTPAHTHPPAW